MKPVTLIAISNALRAGIEANFAPPNQAKELEKLSDLLLEMAASLEMHAIDPETGLHADERRMKYAQLLGELGWLLDVSLGSIFVPHRVGADGLTEHPRVPQVGEGG